MGFKAIQSRILKTQKPFLRKTGHFMLKIICLEKKIVNDYSQHIKKEGELSKFLCQSSTQKCNETNGPEIPPMSFLRQGFSSSLF